MFREYYSNLNKLPEQRAILVKVALKDKHNIERDLEEEVKFFTEDGKLVIPMFWSEEGMGGTGAGWYSGGIDTDDLTLNI